MISVTGAGVAVVLFVAAILTALLYRQTLEYGFDYDDYHFIRPFTSADVARAFHGPWDAAGIETPYFRPLTVAAFAARFELLGLNSRAHHAVSLGLFAVAAALAGAFLWAVTRRLIAALLATALFAVHPSMPYALVAWATNQMHLLEIIVVLLALLWWNAVRARALVWWMPLFIAAIVAFLIKEDGVMLLPAVITLHWLRHRLIEPGLPPVPMPFVLASVGLLAVLIAIRSSALTGMRGPVWPTASAAWLHVTLGLERVFGLVHLRQPWQQPARWFVMLLPLAALLVWRRASAGAKYCLTAGAAVSLLFNMPFVFITKHEQMHVVAFGAVVVLAASALALLDAAGQRMARAVVLLTIAGGAVALGLVARDVSRDFAPFGPMVLAHDRIVREWAAVPGELRAFLARKLENGAERTVPPNPVEALDLVVFGVHPPETSPAGLRYAWMSSARVEMDVTTSVKEITIPLRHEAGAFREPARAEIDADGRRVDSVGLPDGEWRVSRIRLLGAAASPLFGMHRIVVSIEHAWVPAAIVPGSNDTRTLGLQIGTVQVR